MVTTTAPPNPPAAVTRPRRVKTSMTKKRREALAAYAFLAPDVLGLLIFVAVPMVLAFGVAFFKVDGFGNYQYVGLANYKLMGNDDQLWASLRITGIYVISFVPTGLRGQLRAGDAGPEPLQGHRLGPGRVLPP